MREIVHLVVSCYSYILLVTIAGKVLTAKGDKEIIFDSAKKIAVIALATTLLAPLW